MEPIHNRMPVILPQEGEYPWLNPTIEEAEVLTTLLNPFPAEAMEAYSVATFVNSVGNDSLRCVTPIK